MQLRLFSQPQPSPSGSDAALAQVAAEMADQPHALGEGKVVGPQVDQRRAHRFPPLQHEAMVADHSLSASVALENQGPRCGIPEVVVCG